MQIVKTVAEAQAICREQRRAGKTIGLVPTMGALHEGHLSLVRMACKQTQFVAVSLFVNPLQFGPHEDYAKYPRSFEHDRELLEAEKVDLLFAPETSEMYPADAATTVYVQGLSEKLDGRSRPGHFEGVTTVVAKLFNIFQPTQAFFGQKDAAQVAIIRKMVRDLNHDVRIIGMPIVRERDSVAMSSRNTYLDPQQRKAAPVLHRALMRVQMLADTGERSGAKLAQAGREVIAEEPLARLDYFEVADEETLDPVSDISHGALVAVAAYFGTTRLIDNLVLTGVGNIQPPVSGAQPPVTGGAEK